MSKYSGDINEVLQSKIRKTLVRIDILDWNSERKIDSLEGDVISGNISIDGNSAVRRTLNLNVNITDSSENYIGKYNTITGKYTTSIIKDNYNLADPANKLSLNKKVKVFIGVKDLMKEFQNVNGENGWLRKEDKDYVWYQIGIFIITKPTITLSTSSQQIAITLQDKGCLHNGTIGGMIDRPTRFDAETITKDQVNSVVKEGMEQVTTLYNSLTFDNRTTVIENIKNNCIKNPKYSKLWDSESYLVYDFISSINSLEISTDKAAFAKEKTNCDSLLSSILTNTQEVKMTIREIILYAATTFGGEIPGRVIIEDIPDLIRCPVLISKGTTLTTMAKDTSGTAIQKTFTQDTVAYKMIRYTYPDKLTIQPGESVSKVYESCNSVLGGNYQYYYDPNGFFHFEEIKNYKYNRTPSIEDIKESNYKKQYNQSAVAIDFSNDANVISYNNVLDYTNIKNDILLSNTVDGTFIGYHLVIDSKPKTDAYIINTDGTIQSVMDYREFIVHNYNSGAYKFIGKSTTVGGLKNFLDNAENLAIMGAGAYNFCGYVCGTDSGYYVRELNLSDQTYHWDKKDILTSKAIPDYYDELSTIWKDNYYDSNWNKKVSDSYTYNFDIIDADSYLKKFCINSIGRRTFSKTDQSIKSLVPTTLDDDNYFFITNNIKLNSSDTTYKKYFFDDLHTIDISDFGPAANLPKNSTEAELSYPNYGSIYNDAFTAVRELLFNKTIYNSQVTVTSIPYYWLDVNNRAYIYYKKAAIQGYYLINKISYNIDENSIMTVSLTEAGSLEK